MQCKAARCLNATTELQQLSPQADQFCVLAWHADYNCDINQTQ